MKNLLAFLLLFPLAATAQHPFQQIANTQLPQGIACEQTLSKALVYSKEKQQLDGTFTVTLELLDGDIEVKPDIPLRKGKPVFRLLGRETEGKKLHCTFGYDKTDLPYYPQTIGLSWGKGETEGTNAKVYFTPYNTVEVWNETEFWHQKRVWIAERETEPKRRFVHRDSIPASNLPNTREAANSWDDDWNHVFVEGLA